MTSGDNGRTIVRKWFNHLESQLQAEAAHAGLIGHSGSIGDAREFVVKRVLKSFLPACLTIGKGRVFDSSGRMSNQVDVVIFDDRFPCFRYPDGQALYPVEGVVGTIEVKSTWTTAELHAALDNCASVGSLVPAIDQDIVLSIIGPANPAFRGDIESLLRPRTYCFGFDGLKSLETLNEAIREWLSKMEVAGIPKPENVLPEVVVAGGTVAMSVERVKATSLPSTALDHIPSPNDEVIYATINSLRPFAWLGAHLLYAADRWLDFMPQQINVRRSSRAYNPLPDLLKEAMKDPAARIISVDR